MHAYDARAIWLARYVLLHEPALRAWLQRKNVPGLDVDDIVQETYARLSTVESVDNIHNIRNYTFQAAHSVIITHLRHSRIVSIQSVAHLEALETISPEPDPECQTADRDELRRLAEAIANLPVKIRTVFVLRRIDGLSQREVAERLGLSESTVEKHMSKGFRALSAMFGRGGKTKPGASRNEQQGTPQVHATRDGPRD